MRRNVSTGTPWEDLGGYSRAVRIGNSVWVSGTTASDAAGLVQGKDAAAQARFILHKIAGALGLGRFQFQLPVGAHNRLKWVKYGIFAGLVAVSFYSMSGAEKIAGLSG